MHKAGNKNDEKIKEVMGIDIKNVEWAGACSDVVHSGYVFD